MQNKRQRNRLITSILATMVALSAVSQTPEGGGRPQLVVEILIDQLRSDYLELLQNHFGENGFNRLKRDGAYFESVEFNVDNVDIVSGTALLMTGTYPNINGLPSATVYDAQKRLGQKILLDASKSSANEVLSPSVLKVSTVSDELRVNSNGLGYVYSIAPDAQQSILMAGHAGNAAFWINDVNGKWVTSSFYSDYSPQLISVKNYSAPLSSRIDTMSWTPSIALAGYPEIATHRKFYPFRYVFPPSRKDRYTNYKKSALVNEEVTSVAIDFLSTLKLGTRGETDMLNIAYTAAPYSDEAGDGSVELQDTYLRLDRQLGRLFDAIEKSVGLRNTLVFVSSTGYFEDNSKVDSRFKIPSGEFKPSKAKSLLNLYLMAIYGNAQWVDNYYNGSFFLNRKLIKEKNVDLREIREKSSDFLRRMSGVSEAYSLDEVLGNPHGDAEKRMHNGIVMDYAGDVLVKVMPGWSVVENEQTQTQTVKQVRSSVVGTPAFFLHPSIKPQKINTPIDAALLAPTVSRLLRIRSPNAAMSKPYIF